MSTNASAAGEGSGPTVFLSYRREDTGDLSAALSGRLRDDLSTRNVFRDADDLVLGQKWRDRIDDAIGRADSVLVLVGPGWPGGGNVGERRIDRESDVVRLEVATALREDADGKVLPVLVDIEELPEPLPPDLVRLGEYHYVSDSRDGLADEESPGYQSILVGIWAALLQKTPGRLLVLSDAGVSVDLDVVVRQLGLSTSSGARELSSFACGAQLLSVPELEAARDRWPDVLVFSNSEQPSGVLAARLKALDEHPAIRNVALVSAGAVIGVGAAAAVAGSGSQTGTASGLTGMWAAASAGTKLAAAVASVTIVAGGAAVASSILSDDDSSDDVSASPTNLEVSAASSIYQAGFGTPASGTIDPPEEGFAPPSLPVSSGDVVNVDASGVIYFADDGSPPSPGPDGDAGGHSNLSALNGISGFDFPAAMPLVGVFLDRANRPTEAPPPRQDSGDEVEVSPLLGQVFFIGDGLASGQRTDFVVPAGATNLYLGIADGWGVEGEPGYYQDNSGAYEVNISIRKDD